MIPTQSVRLLPFLAAFLWAVLAAGPTRAHDVTVALDAPAAASLTGTVDELVIEDRVNGTLLHVHTLRQDDGSAATLSGVGAETLQKGSRAEVTGALRGSTLEVTGYSVLAAAPIADNGSAAAPNEKQVQGTLVLWHKDYFAEGHGEYGFAVYTDAAQMAPLNLTLSPGMLRPGSKVIASGTTGADGVTLDTTQITVLALPSATPNKGGGGGGGGGPTPTTNNVLVLPITFAGSGADPFTTAEIDQVMRTNTLSTAAYYKEVSYGQQLLDVTVACQTTKPSGCANNTDSNGWLVTSSTLPGGCDFTTMGELADAAATAAGYDISSYNNRFYVLPGGSGCGWAGLAYVGFPYQAWSAGYNALWVYGHELGHNFTLYHAGSLDCAPQVLGGTCSLAEYGDRFDVMGNNTNTGQQMHFNATQKALLGWIPASSVITQTSGTKTYNLAPLEAGGQSTYAVKIPVAADTNRTYWIEYRQPTGLFDATLSAYPNKGAIIHVAEPFDYPCTGGCFADDTQILDMTPGTAGDFFDAALLVGQTYTDSTYNVRITVNSATVTALNVTVAVAGAPPTPTTTTIASSVNPSTVGASVIFTASVTGSSPTGSVNFTDGESSIAGCAAVTLTGSGNTRSAQCSTGALTQGTHSIVASYGGDSGNAASASAPLSEVVNAGSGGGTKLSSSLNPAQVKQSVTFTATVTGTSPTGKVSFTSNGVAIAHCSSVVLTGSGNSKTAKCATSFASAATYTIGASYSGDGSNAPSSAPTLSEVVAGNAKH